MKQLVFLNSHPIQYFAPLYQQMAESDNLQLTVWYCSDESIRGKMDKGFGQAVSWDIPLLDGYPYEFIHNISWKPSVHKGFFGLINPGVIRLLYKQPRSLIIIHGWAYCTNILAIVFGKLFGHTICLRSETPLNQELKKNAFITFLKRIWLRFIFLFIDRFLYIGKQNRLFYQSMGVKDADMIFTPYAVDNDRFCHLYQSTGKDQAKDILKLPAEKKIILYSGKYIEKKRPMDLLMSFKELNDENVMLVMVGDGELRGDMESYINSNALSGKVLLTGFINQAEIPLYYRAADIFVMCSGQGETWGLSVNEAMNFGLPVIISDTCGSGYDLVENKQNGAVFETGNIKQLTLLLREYLLLDPQQKMQIEKTALNKIDQYSFKQITRAIESIT